MSRCTATILHSAQVGVVLGGTAVVVRHHAIRGVYAAAAINVVHAVVGSLGPTIVVARDGAAGTRTVTLEALEEILGSLQC